MPYQHLASSKAPTSISTPKEAEENMVLASGLVNYYNSFLAGDLPPQISFPDLDQIHTEDVEDMHISPRKLQWLRLGLSSLLRRLGITIGV